MCSNKAVTGSQFCSCCKRNLIDKEKRKAARIPVTKLKDIQREVDEQVGKSKGMLHVAYCMLYVLCYMHTLYTNLSLLVMLEMAKKAAALRAAHIKSLRCSEEAKQLAPELFEAPTSPSQQVIHPAVVEQECVS